MVVGVHIYLPGLAVHKKWFQTMVSVKISDLVLVVDYGTLRGSWPLGRIERVNLAMTML